MNFMIGKFRADIHHIFQDLAFDRFDFYVWRFQNWSHDFVIKLCSELLIPKPVVEKLYKNIVTFSLLKELHPESIQPLPQAKFPDVFFIQASYEFDDRISLRRHSRSVLKMLIQPIEHRVEPEL